MYVSLISGPLIDYESGNLQQTSKDLFNDDIHRSNILYKLVKRKKKEKFTKINMIKSRNPPNCIKV
jgi:hypothetical protein